MIYYLVFALATALAALYELFYPVVKEIRQTLPESMVARKWGLTLFSLVVFATVVAPFVFPSCIVPKLGARFRHVLFEQLKQHN